MIKALNILFPLALVGFSKCGSGVDASNDNVPKGSLRGGFLPNTIGEHQHKQRQLQQVDVKLQTGGPYCWAHAPAKSPIVGFPDSEQAVLTLKNLSIVAHNP